MTAARLLALMAVLAVPAPRAGELEENRDNVATVVQNFLLARSEGGFWEVQPEGARSCLRLKLLAVEKATLRPAGPRRYEVLARFAQAGRKRSYEAAFTVGLGSSWSVASLRWLSPEEARSFREDPPEAAAAEAEERLPPLAPADGSSSPAGAGAPQPFRLTLDSELVVYGPEGRAVTQAALEAISLRGLSASLTPAATVEDLRALELMPRLKAAGVVGPKESVSFPIFSVDGAFYSRAAVESALAALPLQNPREKDGPYIVVYGLRDCPVTRRERLALQKNGLPFEFRDVDDPRYRPRFEALQRAQKLWTYAWPVLDINGKLFSQPSLDTIRANF